MSNLFYLIIPIAMFCFAYVLYWHMRFSNKFRLTVLIGKKGSGKTTLLTKYAYLYKKKGWTVYSNFTLPGTYTFDPAELGKLMFQPYSLILIDEIGLVFNNREFKSFRKDQIAFFKLQRHYGAKVVACSQADDYDKSLRLLVDELYLLDNWLNVLSVARRVNRFVTIQHPDSGVSESRIVEDLQFSPWFTIPFGGAIFTWIPHWAKYFNSFEAPELPLKNFTYVEDKTNEHPNDHNRIFTNFKPILSLSASSKTLSVLRRKNRKKENVADDNKESA